MLDYKVILGALAVIVGLAGYPPYFKDVFRGATKPHLFSWIIWTLIQGTAFFAAITKGGGAGTWFVGAAAIACFSVAVSAAFYGEKNITTFDWVSFFIALLGIAAWAITSNPLWAVILVTIADLFGFAPTFRKSFSKPQEETLFNYGAAIVGNALAVAAVQSYSITTWLYPASLVISNGAFIAMAMVRRSQLKQHA